MRRNHLILLGVFTGLILLTAMLLLRRPAETPRSRVFSSRIHSSVALQPPVDDNLYRVVRVIDGDTIDVFTDGGQSVRIRLIGIDAPETLDQRKPIQCYGPEASARMKELLTGKSVLLEAKPDEDRDDYGRLLRYVMLDQKDIGGQMLEEGYARSLCYAFPHPRCSAYDAWEREARSAKRGRWGSCQ